MSKSVEVLRDEPTKPILNEVIAAALSADAQAEQKAVNQMLNYWMGVRAFFLKHLREDKVDIFNLSYDEATSLKGYGFDNLKLKAYLSKHITPQDVEDIAVKYFDGNAARALKHTFQMAKEKHNELNPDAYSADED